MGRAVPVAMIFLRGGGKLWRVGAGWDSLVGRSW